MAKNVLVGDVLQLAVEGRTDLNQRARLPSQPVWAVAPPGFLSLEPAADGLTCVATAVAPGDCVLRVTCGALPPETYEVSVLPGAATHLVVRLA